MSPSATPKEIRDSKCYQERKEEKEQLQKRIKELEEKERKAAEQKQRISRKSSKKHRDKKKREAEQAAERSMSFPPAELSHGVQSPPFTMPRHVRHTHMPLSNLTPMQLPSQ